MFRSSWAAPEAFLIYSVRYLTGWTNGRWLFDVGSPKAQNIYQEIQFQEYKFVFFSTPALGMFSRNTPRVSGRSVNSACLVLQVSAITQQSDAAPRLDNVLFVRLFSICSFSCTIFSVFSSHFTFPLRRIDPFLPTGIIKVSSNLNKLLLLIERWGLRMEKMEQLLTKRLRRILELKWSASPVYRLCIVNGEWISISDFILFTVCLCAVWLKVA